MAHTKAGGTTKTNRDSISKRLGVKCFGGEKVKVGSIIVRQKGNKFYPGVGIKQGNDFTLFAAAQGVVEFTKKKGKNFVNING